jgi:hypothetical protein
MNEYIHNKLKALKAESGYRYPVIYNFENL